MCHQGVLPKRVQETETTETETEKNPLLSYWKDHKV